MILPLFAILPAVAHAQSGDALAYGGRAVPPMTAPELPGDWDKAPTGPASKRQWDRTLPFFAQRAIDMGVELPNPYNVGISLYYGREERVLSSLKVGFNGQTPQDLAFVQFPKSTIHNQSPQLHLGGWLLPFMNVYGIVGQTQGGGDIDIAIPGKDLLQFLVPGSCSGAVQVPLCSRTVTGTAKADYHGTTHGAGMTLAGAWHELFFALPITYVISDVTISDTLGKTWNIAPRVGWNQHLSESMLTWYAGGTYLKSDMNITGTFIFDTSDAGPPVPATTTMQYSIHVEPKDRWNYLAGVNWTIDRSWGVLAELGFGNTRSDVIVTGFFRF